MLTNFDKSRLSSKNRKIVDKCLLSRKCSNLNQQTHLKTITLSSGFDFKNFNKVVMRAIAIIWLLCSVWSREFVYRLIELCG